LLAACASSILAQNQPNGDYRLALPDHKGQLTCPPSRWQSEYIPGMRPQRRLAA